MTSTRSERRRSCARPTAVARETPGGRSGSRDQSAVIDVELFGDRLVPETLSLAAVQRLCNLAGVAMGVVDGHLAIEFVSSERIAQLNAEHRDKPTPTDVLSFPIDGVEAIGGAPRELGDIVICPEHTADVREAIVHGALHLLGMDHEADAGEMLALQAELLARVIREDE
jgi:probable rRNA maturation factor